MPCAMNKLKIYIFNFLRNQEKKFGCIRYFYVALNMVHLVAKNITLYA